MKLASLLGVVCLSAAAMAQDVTFNYDRSANFGSYRTYQWAESQNGNQLMDQNIKQSIDAQLALKGLRRVESGADLKVGYQVATEKEKQFDGWGSGPRFYGNARVTTSTIEIGKIAVEMTDSAQNRTVWRGMMQKTLDIKKNPDKNFQNLQKAMAKLFKNYPPEAGKS